MGIMAARSGDGPAIKGLLESASLPIADITDKSLERFLVHRDGSKVIGTVGLELDVGVALLRSLVVAEDMRGRGLAAELLGAAEALAEQCGIRDLYLLTTSAETYFSVRGYKSVDRKLAPAALQRMPQFQGLCPSSSILMTKNL